MFKLSKVLEKIGIVIAIIVALAIISGGLLVFWALKDLDNPRFYIYCAPTDKVPFADYSATDIHLRFQEMYETAYNNNGSNYKLKKIIAPRNITLEEYYNNLNKFNPTKYEYFVNDKGEIVECGPRK